MATGVCPGRSAADGGEGERWYGLGNGAAPDLGSRGPLTCGAGILACQTDRNVCPTQNDGQRVALALGAPFGVSVVVPQQTGVLLTRK
jgi:hypothetical protein